MKKFILFFYILFFNSGIYAQTCIDEIVEKIYNKDYNANYYILVPVETLEFESASLLICKKEFQNYVTILDSVYSSSDSIKAYLKDILKRKKKMYFDEYLFSEFYEKPKYWIISGENIIDISSEEKKISFLKKYLNQYSPDTDFYNIISTLPNPVRRYDSIIETFFKLDYLVAEGDGVIGVYKVSCK